MNMLQKVTTGAAAGAFMTALFATSTFAATITVAGNGSNSNNTVTSVKSNTSSVKQTNKTAVTSFVNSSAKSGGNKANYNTGGASIAASGPATSVVGITVTGGSNSNLGLPCGCLDLLPSSVDIIGNGDGSHNTVTTVDSSSSTVTQKNTTVVTSFVNSTANSGGNEASHNTGGASSATSDEATSSVGISVGGSTNDNGGI